MAAVTLEALLAPSSGTMWAMKGLSSMSSSSQVTCTAYSPGSVGQYSTSQEPSFWSLHSILACDGPSMANPEPTTTGLDEPGATH